MSISNKFQILFKFLLLFAFLSGHENKIAVGGFSTDGLTKDEKSWFINQLETKADAMDYIVLRSSEIIAKLNHQNPNLLTCMREECSKEVGDLLDIKLILLPKVEFHEKGVNTSLYLYSSHHFKNIAEVTEEHPPLKLTAVAEIFSETYLPDVLEEYERIVRPEIQILQPAKFSPIQENHKLDLLLNINDNRGLAGYTIYYSDDAGESYNPVKSGKFNNEILMENFAISVPVSSGITDQAKIRVVVRDSDGNFSSQTSELFSVIDNTPPSINVISPQKAEIIKGSNEFKMEWTGTDNLGIDSYNITYSVDGKKTWKNIVDLDGSYSHFVWNVPDLLTNECYIKVIATDFTGLTTEVKVGPISVMDGLAPNLRLLTSMGEKEIPENSNVNFTFGFKDNTGVKIAEAYYTVDQVSFSLLHQSIFENLIKDDTLSINIKIPTGLTPSARLKWVVKDLFENETSLQTHSFSVTDNTPPVNTIIYPVDGVKLKGNEIGKVIWDANDNTSIVSHEIFYSVNTGKTWLFLGRVDGDKNNYIWKIPDIQSNEMRMKVTTTDAVGLNTSSISAMFEVYDASQPIITLVKPEKLQIFDEKSTVNFEIIVEDNIQLNMAEVYLKHGFQSQRIGSSKPDENPKLINLNVEKQLIAPPGDSLQLIILAKDDAGNSSEYSSDKFVLRDITPPIVRFETTMTEMVLDGNSEFDIQWHARDNVGIQYIHIEFSSDGLNWVELLRTNEEIFVHNWQVPNLQETDCKLRLTAKDVNGFTSTTESDLFSILDKSGPELTISFPQKGTILKELETITVSSYVHDDYGLGLVELWFSPDGENFNYYSNEAFTSNVKNDSVQFTFTIPQGMSHNATFKFIAIDRFNNEKDYFTEPFSIIDNTEPVISFVKNIPDNTIGTGEPVKISWSMSDNWQLSTTLLEYYVDEHFNWTQLTHEKVSGIDNEQLFVWVVPETHIGSCKLRATVTDKTGLSVSAIYDGINIVDKTVPKVTWLSPVLPFYALEGEPLEITAELMDNHALKTLEFYYASNGKRFTFLHSKTDLSGDKMELIENVIIPFGVTENAIMKLVLIDSEGNASSAISENFKVRDNIKPEISISSIIPESVKTGDIFTIEWDASDNEVLRSHKISFSHKGNGEWQELKVLASTNRIWSWTIPNIVTDAAQFEIVVEDHVHLFDTVYTDLFSIIDKTKPEIKIPKSADRIEVKEGAVLPIESIILSDNVALGKIKIEYSNTPRKFSEISIIDLTEEDSNQINFDVDIPIPYGVTKNAKLQFTLEDNSGNFVKKQIRGIRIKDNTPPEIKFTNPFVENELNPEILLVGEDMVFNWDGSDNSGIMSYKLSYNIKPETYLTGSRPANWVHMITLPGSVSEYIWNVPEKAVGECRFKIKITDRVGLTNEYETGLFAIEDMLDSSRDKHLRKYGTLSLSSFPEGAQILLDNDEKGYTPLTIPKIPNGTYQVTLFKENYHHVSKLINVLADTTIYSLDSLKLKTEE